MTLISSLLERLVTLKNTLYVRETLELGPNLWDPSFPTFVSGTLKPYTFSDILLSENTLLVVQFVFL